MMSAAANKLYTSDGREYQIKTASNLSQGIINYTGQFVPFSKRVMVNYKALLPEVLHINTNKKIIPLSFNISAFTQSTGANFLDVSNCYSFARSGGGLSILGDYLKYLAKTFPLVQRVFYTNSNFNNFILPYKNLVFHSGDFISVADETSIYFTDSLAGSMLADTNGSVISVSIFGRVTQTSLFTYLELQ